MTKFSRHLFERCSARRTPRQRADFRRRMTELFYENGYPVSEERFGLLLRRVNYIVGDPDEAGLIVAARYSNRPTSLLPNLRLPKHRLLHWLYRFFLCLLLVFAALAAEDFYFHLTERYLGSLMVFFLLILIVLLLHFFGPTLSRHANDNASAVIAAVESLRTFSPQELRDLGVAFVFFDDPPLLPRGERAFARRHPDCDEALVLYLDSIGWGDHLLFACSQELRADQELCEELIAAIENHPHKSNTVSVAEKCVLPAGAHVFEKSVCISSFSRGLFGVLVSFRSRTFLDRKLDQTNLDLVTALIRRLSGGEDV
ncbi:MAG: M28 family peptidase [Clostridia bacterium]|nr:M28 family peptidase [Clostridia bacterium]